MLKIFKLNIRKIFTVLFAAVICFHSWNTGLTAEQKAQDNSVVIASSSSAVKDDLYLSYDEKYSNIPDASETISIDPLNYETMEGASQKEVEGEISLVSGDTGSVTYRFFVPETGRYVLQIRYCPIAGKGASIDREIMIDGNYPFSEARELVFGRTYKEKEEGIRVDNNGNEYYQGSEELFRWTDYKITDSYGYYNKPFSFRLEKGEHTLTLCSMKESVAISKITFLPPDSAPSYQQYYEDCVKKGAVPSTSKMFFIEAEKPALKSDTILFPTFDRSSPDTTPVSEGTLKLNIISGSQWQQAGQWMEWNLTVPEDGFYKISFRVRQGYNDGMFTSRKLLIDGTIPFAEAENINFPYNTKWQVLSPGGKNPYQFYLKNGSHTLRLQNTLCEMSRILIQTDQILKQLNACYVDILTITGPSPDQFRDYKLDQLIPETILELQSLSKQLYEIIHQIRNIAGVKGAYLAPLERVAVECGEMSSEPSDIPQIFETFKNDIGSLASWVTNSQLQPLDIDKIYISSPSQDISASHSNIFQKMWHSIMVFLSSFYNDINSFNTTQDSASLTVWIGAGVAAGRDQAVILKRMIDDTFTVQNKIPVNFQLVAGGVLLPATLSGNGPDVALRIGSTDAMNFALRGSVKDISGLPGFDAVKQRFHSSAFIPLSYGNACYGLPEVQSFPVMFYRTDILKNLGLEPPGTWDDVYAMLPVLQRNNMNFAIPVTNFSSSDAYGISGNVSNGMKSYAMLLYQRDGNFYLENGKSSALGGKVQTEVFEDWTSLFKDYKLPLSYDFANRFATGEIPVGIADYTLYNQLMVSFPEIKGLWSFSEVPGTTGSDGGVNHTVPGDVTGVIIMNNAKNVSGAWEFIKFWTSSETQIRFGREIESLLGPSSRWPSANLDALKQTAWKNADLKNLLEQLNHVKGIPEVPGGYYTSRYLDLSFRRVVYYNDNAKDTLIANVRTINDELTAKRKEFHLGG